MEINGLPVHALAVHAAVVFGPLGALTALVYAVVGRLRDRLRWPMVVMSLVATGAVAVAFLSGNNLLDTRPALERIPQVEVHEDRAGLLIWLTLAFGAIALVTGWLHSRTGAIRVVLSIALAGSALAVLVQVVRTGDAGTRAVWGDVAAER